MKRTDFLAGLKSPLPNARLDKYPNGDIRQYWSENPQLYSPNMGELHAHLGGHTGIDIATFHRDSVYASHDGYVPAHMVFDEPTRPGGREVWVYSDPLDGEEPVNSIVCTVYCHLDQIAVTPGARVKKGDLLGYEGNTGFVGSDAAFFWGNAPAGVGTHLHFGLYELIHKNGYWQQRYNKNLPLKGSSDPLPYISDPTPFDDVADGNLGGLRNVLENAKRYLLSLIK